MDLCRGSYKRDCGTVKGTWQQHCKHMHACSKTRTKTCAGPQRSHLVMFQLEVTQVLLA